MVFETKDNHLQCSHIDQERTRARLSKQERLGKANTHFAQNNVTTNDSNRVTFTHGICRNQKKGATVIITISRKYQLRKMWCSKKLFLKFQSLPPQTGVIQTCSYCKTYQSDVFRSRLLMEKDAVEMMLEGKKNWFLPFNMLQSEANSVQF